MVGTAVFAAFWVAVRSWVQSITIDEADTYLFWVGRQEPFYWRGGANNHILNSILMSLFTSVFGVSHLSVRAPAILGALLYIFAAFLLCRALMQDGLAQWTLFVCLVYNPLIMDYLVAARGYGLGLAFLMMSITAPCLYELQPEFRRSISLPALCCFCSITLALSFSSNFSFAIVDGMALLAVLFWARRTQRHLAQVAVPNTVSHNWARIYFSLALPGLIVAAFFCTSVLQDWKSIELVYGAKSLHETWKSVLSASLYELNPWIVNRLIYPFLQWFQISLLPPFLGAAVLVQLILVLIHWKSLRAQKQIKPLVDFASALLGVLVATLLIHRLAYHFYRLLLPMERTAIYIVPLVTLIVGCLAAVGIPSRAGDLSRTLLKVSLTCLAAFCLMSMRLRYFREWKYDANVKEIHDVLVSYHRWYGVKDVPSHWRYSASLRFYDRMAMTPIVSDTDTAASYPEDRKAYVLYYPDDEQFIAAHHLKVVYHGDMSDAVVAVDSGLPAVELP